MKNVCNNEINKEINKSAAFPTPYDIIAVLKTEVLISVIRVM